LEKNPSPILNRDKANIEYISGGQLSLFELAFGIELGPNPHSKMVSESILDPLNGSPTMHPSTKPKSVGHEGVYWKKSKFYIG